MDYDTICGAATPSTVNPATPIAIVGGQVIGIGLIDAQKYLTIPQATFETYFTFTASPIGCRPFGYSLLASTSPDVFYYSSRVTLAG